MRLCVCVHLCQVGKRNIQGRDAATDNVAFAVALLCMGFVQFTVYVKLTH